MKIVLFASIFVLFISAIFVSAEGSVTASENYCEQFPTFPECTGWRTIPISDNFWFCEYVDLPTMCKNPPDPKKQTITYDADYCCRLFDEDTNSLYDSFSSYDKSHLTMIENGLALPELYPVNELVMWTDKDHYEFGDRVNVYGKFNFEDPTIKDSNRFVDVKFNGKTVISNLPVRDNGWFASHFFLSDERFFWNGLSEITISYKHKSTMGQPDNDATFAYKFTTGAIKEPENTFSIIVSDLSLFSNTISYKTDPQNPVSVLLQPTLISRLTNPDGVVFSLPTNSMDDLNTYVNEISSFKNGNYTITMTVGDFTTTQEFMYVENLNTTK